MKFNNDLFRKTIKYMFASDILRNANKKRNKSYYFDFKVEFESQYPNVDGIYIGFGNDEQKEKQQ